MKSKSVTKCCLNILHTADEHFVSPGLLFCLHILPAAVKSLQAHLGCP